MAEEQEKRWIVGKLEEDPNYRPYCMNCSTMARLTLREENGRRTLTCDMVAESGPGADMLRELGIPGRVGCGGSYDVDTGEWLAQPKYR